MIRPDKPCCSEGMSCPDFWEGCCERACASFPWKAIQRNPIDFRVYLTGQQDPDTGIIDDPMVVHDSWNHTDVENIIIEKSLLDDADDILDLWEHKIPRSLV